jgi:hypothetical protein
VQEYGMDQGHQEQIQEQIQRSVSVRKVLKRATVEKNVVVEEEEQPYEQVVRRRSSRVGRARVVRRRRQVVAEEEDDVPEMHVVRRRRHGVHTQHYESHKSVTVKRLRRIISQLREAKAECVSKTGVGSVFSRRTIVEELDGAHEVIHAPQPEPSTSDLSKLFGTSVNLDANVKAIEEME